MTTPRNRDRAAVTPAATTAARFSRSNPVTGDRALDAWINNVNNTLSIGTGVGRTPFDRWLTARDLVNWGLINDQQASTRGTSRRSRRAGILAADGTALSINDLAELLRNTTLMQELLARRAGSTTVINRTSNRSPFTEEVGGAATLTVANTGATTGTINLDWSAAQVYEQDEPTGNITYTFTDPAAPCRLQINVNSDGTSTARSFTMPGNVKQFGAEWTGTVANKEAVISLWFDGSDYKMQAANEV